MPFWFNTSTGQVESDDTRGQGEDVLGPYATEDEAARALEIAAAKTKAWDAADQEWDAKGAAESWQSEGGHDS